MTMKITITHCKYTPMWETLQKLVQEVTDVDGRFIRIARKDRGCDYRGRGEYQVDYLTAYEVIPIDISIKG